MEKDFDWLKRIIDSITSDKQIDCCVKLIELYKIKHWSDDLDELNEDGFNFFVTQLNNHLKVKVKKYSLINEQ